MRFTAAANRSSTVCAVCAAASAGASRTRTAKTRGNTRRLWAHDAERAHLLVEVGALDAEGLSGARDVPVVFRELVADEVALDLLAELAQGPARVAREID